MITLILRIAESQADRVICETFIDNGGVNCGLQVSNDAFFVYMGGASKRNDSLPTTI